MKPESPLNAARCSSVRFFMPGMGHRVKFGKGGSCAAARACHDSPVLWSRAFSSTVRAEDSSTGAGALETRAGIRGNSAKPWLEEPWQRRAEPGVHPGKV